MSATTARNSSFVLSMRSSRSRSRPELVEQACHSSHRMVNGSASPTPSFEIRKVAITGGAAHDDRPGRRDSSGRDVGGRRHDHLRDQPSRHGVAARLGQRWRARHVDAARPRAWGSRPSLARNSARRPRRPLYDYVANGRSSMQPRWLCATCAQERRKYLCAVAATRTTSPAGTWSTLRRARYERSPSMSIGSRPTVLRSRCCRWSRRWVSEGRLSGESRDRQ